MAAMICIVSAGSRNMLMMIISYDVSLYLSNDVFLVQVQV